MNAPTLLVGLGGTGCDIIHRVSEMVSDEERHNIAFAVFDTDINDLRTIEENNPFVKTIQTSTKQTVGEYLNQDTHARDTWFPVNAVLNSKTLTEGAGQVRSISRLAFETVIRAGKLEPLHQAIQSLYKIEEDKPEQALRVMIVSSLAGGTGSGLLLPVAMYIRHYLESHFRRNANIIRGFFILPEVFFEVIPGPAEQNNLKANAYATLRELDAFLMRGDNTLDERYKSSVRMLFPRAESSGYEEYSVRPYDFCFLFDAQNADGGKLDSFEQYKDHAANCIYAMSIGPMNKRSNSAEDNTIRKLTRERGRNRYAGAGSSMLVYPFEDIRKFMALQWAKQNISKKWLVFDEDYKELQRENQRRRDEGVPVNETSLEDFYTTQIESLAKHDDAFARSIVRACTRLAPDGVTEKGRYWNEYVNAITNKVKDDLEKGSSSLSAKKDELEMIWSTLDKKGDAYVSYYREANSYYYLTKAYVEGTAQNLAFAMFKSKDNKGFSDQKYRLEYYLTSAGGNYMHPNAIRYFLIQARNQMVKARSGNSQNLKDVLESIDTAEETIFDDTKTTNRIEKASDFEDKTVSKGESQNKKELLEDYVNNIDEYRTLYVSDKVYDEGIKYLNKLIEAFTQFYTSFEGKVDSIDKDINAIYRKYADRSGSTTRYVCASRTCLDKILQKRPYLGSPISIDSELAREIYVKVANYADLKEKPSNNRYFADLFDKDIMGYFKKSVMKSYGDEIDIDIITALENEAVYEYEGEREDLTDALIEQYVARTIQNVRALSCPFIESPLGQKREPIYSCTFNTCLKPEKGDDSPRTKLIKKEMMNRGGVPDEDIPKGKLLFYQSFYGLRANDLSKFAPPETSQTYDRTGGEYFTAYFDLIKGIHPETHRSTEITPHIDRWWHIDTKMPDIDDGHQLENEKKTYAAFFWGLIGEYIYLTSDDENLSKKIYKSDNDNLKMHSSKLIVSNGTVCDKLYEALDAVAIYPELKEKILERIRIRTDMEAKGSKPLKERMLYDFLNNFRISEPQLGTGDEPARSIFSLPMMMKKSVAPDEYYEENVVELLRVEIEEISNYLKSFCKEKEFKKAFRDILMEQFELFINDTKLESAVDPDVFQETLFFRVCSIIATVFEDMYMEDERKYVSDIATKQRRG